LTAIPNVIHQIWLGGLDARPARIVAAMTRVEEVFGDYAYRLWTEADFAALDIERYARIRPYSALSDLMRYRILFLHGGWYLDVDCEPLGEKPSLPRGGDVFVPDMAGKNLATAAFLGGIPGLPLFRDAADACMATFDAVIEGRPVDGNMFRSVGPKMLWRLCRRHRVHLRRWQRWMANVHPDSPLIHRHLSSWQGQRIHLEEAP